MGTTAARLACLARVPWRLIIIMRDIIPAQGRGEPMAMAFSTLGDTHIFTTKFSDTDYETAMDTGPTRMPRL